MSRSTPAPRIFDADSGYIRLSGFDAEVQQQPRCR
jgi:hypothetical protein